MIFCLKNYKGKGMQRRHMNSLMRELTVHLSERPDKQFTAYQMSNFLGVGSAMASTYILKLVKRGAVRIAKRGKRSVYEVIPKGIEGEL